jgi:hypothetical protein
MLSYKNTFSPLLCYRKYFPRLCYKDLFPRVVLQTPIFPALVYFLLPTSRLSSAHSLTGSNFTGSPIHSFPQFVVVSPHLCYNITLSPLCSILYIL